MNELTGRCGECGNRLEFRQTEVRENEDDKSSKILCWLIYGHCEKCGIVYMQDILHQEKEPQLEDEITINWNKDAEVAEDENDLK